jgi:hypothetical protein
MIVIALCSSDIGSFTCIEVEVRDKSVESGVMRISSIVNCKSSRIVMIDVVIGECVFIIFPLDIYIGLSANLTVSEVNEEPF